MRNITRNRNHRTAQHFVAAGMGFLLAGGSLIGFATMTSAASVTPTYYEGNRSCGALGYDDEFKIDGAPSDGSYALNVDGTPGTLTIAGATATQFDFTSTILVSGVFVKAADGGYLYDYLPGGTLADTDVYSPNTQGNTSDNQAEISHVSFCFGGGETTTTTESTTTTTESTTTTTAPTTTTTAPPVTFPPITFPPVTGVTVPPTTVAPTTTVPDTTTTEVPPVTGVTVPPSEPAVAPTTAPPVIGVTELAFTGDHTSELLVLGLILVGLGALFLVGGVRRTQVERVS